MPSQARLSPAARREQLLSVAREMLRSRPAGEVTIEAVASAAGVSAGLVFHYFGSQREFRRAVTELAVTELLSAMETSADLPPTERLRAGLDTFTLAVVRSPELFVTVVQAADSLASGFRSTIISWLREAVQDAGVAMTPVLETALVGWLAFAERVILDWVTSESLSREEVVELCSRAFPGVIGAAGIPPERLLSLLLRRHSDASLLLIWDVPAGASGLAEGSWGKGFSAPSPLLRSHLTGAHNASPTG